jgi:hypothetical protein
MSALWQKIKDYLGVAFALTIAFLGFLLTRKSQQVDRLKSELAHEKTSEELKQNELEREHARKDTLDALAEFNARREAYEKLRRDDM